MQFLGSVITALCAISVNALPVTADTQNRSGDYYALGCPKTTKPWASSSEQLTAITNYYSLLFGGKVDQSFDTYTAKSFINHAPEVTGDGTAAAKAAVSGLLTQSKEEIYNIFVGNSKDGTAYGHVYFKGINSKGVGAIMEYWRFAGNCLVEHWNVAEEASGNFTNPKAFF